MGLRALPLSSSHKAFSPNSGVAQTFPKHHRLSRSSKFVVVSSKVDGENDKESKKGKQSLFSSVTEALDFSQVRSAEDAQLLEDARDATRSGGRMSREQVHLQKPAYPSSSCCIIILLCLQFQLMSGFFLFVMQYGALRRKIGGTYKDFFKSYIEGNHL